MPSDTSIRFADFWTACLHGHLATVTQYVDGVDLRSTEQGWTALGVALKYRHSNIVACLLPRSDLSQTDALGSTPLMSVIREWHDNGVLEMVNNLIPRSDLRQADNEGRTALMWAAQSPLSEIPGAQVSIVQALLPGSELSQIDHQGRTAWKHAQEAGCSEVGDMLMKHERVLLTAVMPPMGSAAPSSKRVRL